MFILWLIIFIIFLIIARCLFGTKVIYYQEYWILEDMTDEEVEDFLLEIYNNRRFR